jgi:peptidoglycan/LPS O-acetylase OafA/YrhL
MASPQAFPSSSPFLQPPGAPLPLNAPKIPGQRMPALDCLRGAAICGVILYHGIAGSAPPNQLTGWKHFVSSVTVYGNHGVTLFFVLSGFLITDILLNARTRTNNYYSTFYIRRLLRIAPAYLATLFILRVSSSISWGYVVIALAYLTNVSSLFRHENEYGPLWSLSVEEQFYLVWPWTVRHLSPARFTTLCIGLIALSPILRFLVLAFPSGLRDVHAKTPLISDTFAMGALVAIVMRSPHWDNARLSRLARALIFAGLVLMALYSIGVRNSASARFMPSFELCPYIFLFAGIIIWSILHPQIARSAVGIPLAFIGDISYGLYLIHQFVFQMYDRIVATSRFADVIGHMDFLVLRLAVCLALSVGVATLSRYTFERRFLDLKNKLAGHSTT